MNFRNWFTNNNATELAAIKAALGTHHWRKESMAVSVERLVSAYNIANDWAGQLMSDSELLEQQRNNAWDELWKIRELIKADPNESTYDEVERVVSGRQKPPIVISDYSW